MAYAAAGYAQNLPYHYSISIRFYLLQERRPHFIPLKASEPPPFHPVERPHFIRENSGFRPVYCGSFRLYRPSFSSSPLRDLMLLPPEAIGRIQAMRILGSIALFIWASSLSATPDLTVGPLRLGMSKREVSQALGLQYKPGKQLTSDNPLGPSVVTYRRGSEEEILLQFVSDRLYMIDRVQLFPPGSQPGKQETMQRVIQKYGVPSDRSLLHANWQWDATGKLMPGLQCNVDSQQLIQSPNGAISLPDHPDINGSTVYYTDFSDCNVSLSVDVHGPRELVQSLSVVLEDRQPMYRMLNGNNKQRQQQQQQQDNKSKQTQAPL